MQSLELRRLAVSRLRSVVRAVFSAVVPLSSHLADQYCCLYPPVCFRFLSRRTFFPVPVPACLRFRVYKGRSLTTALGSNLIVLTDEPRMSTLRFFSGGNMTKLGGIANKTATLAFMPSCACALVLTGAVPFTCHLKTT